MENEIKSVLTKSFMEIRKIVNREIWPTRLMGLSKSINTSLEERNIEKQACNLIIKHTMDCISSILNEPTINVEYENGDILMSIDNNGKFVKLD